MNEALALAEPDDEPCEEQPAGGSFFACYDPFTDDIDEVLRADDAACAAVWNMYCRDSNGRGFDARTAAQRKITAWRKAHPNRGLVTFDPREAAMKEKIQQAHAELSTKLERPPTAREVYEAAGVSCSPQYVAKILTRAGLSLTKRRGPNTVKIEEPTKAPRGATRTTAAPRLAPWSTPAIAVLRAELAVCEKRAATVRQAIALLEAR